MTSWNSMLKKSRQFLLRCLERVLEWFQAWRGLWFSLHPHGCYPFAGHQPSKDQSQTPPGICHSHKMCHPPLMYHALRSAWWWQQGSTLAFGAKSLLPWFAPAENCALFWKQGRKGNRTKISTLFFFFKTRPFLSIHLQNTHATVEPPGNESFFRQCLTWFFFRFVHKRDLQSSHS